jgi:hypothetical protein
MLMYIVTTSVERRRYSMEICVDIDEELLSEFDRAARDHNITRNIAVRGAITAWLAQVRRDAAIHELFDMEFDPVSSGGDGSASESSSAPPTSET